MGRRVGKAGSKIVKAIENVIDLADDKASDALKKIKAVDITIDKSKYPEAAKHIEDAQKAGKSTTGKIDRKGAKARRKESLKGHPSSKNYDRDEYPPAVLDTGGKGASVRNITPSDNRGAGASMGGQMRRLPDGTLVRIVVK